MKKSTKYFVWGGLCLVAMYINGLLSAHSDSNHPYYTKFYLAMAVVFGSVGLVLIWVGAYQHNAKNK